MKRIAVLLFAPLLLLLGLAPAASATQITTRTVTWVTSLADGVTTPHGANDVTWPQTLLTEDAPPCGVVLQIDKYKYNTEGQVAFVNALVAHGTLNKPGSETWTDSAVIISYTFVVEEPCPTPDPTPTPTITPDPTPTPSPQCGVPPNTLCSETPTPDPTPTPSASPSATPLISVTPSPSRTPTPVVRQTPPPAQLPFTGVSKVLLMFVLAAGLVGSGLAFLWVGKSRRRRNSL